MLNYNAVSDNCLMCVSLDVNLFLSILFSPFTKGGLGVDSKQTEHQKIWLEETSEFRLPSSLTTFYKASY